MENELKVVDIFIGTTLRGSAKGSGRAMYIMNTDWNEAHIQFRNRYNRTAQQLKTLVMYSGVLFDRFNTAVNTYINAASKPEVESAPVKEA